MSSLDITITNITIALFKHANCYNKVAIKTIRVNIYQGRTSTPTRSKLHKTSQTQQEAGLKKFVSNVNQKHTPSTSIIKHIKPTLPNVGNKNIDNKELEI